MRLGSSVGRVLARQVRGPGFKPQSGQEFFSPVTERCSQVDPFCRCISVAVPGQFTVCGDSKNLALKCLSMSDHECYIKSV